MAVAAQQSRFEPTDAEWLCGPEAAIVLADLAENNPTPDQLASPSLATRLRKSFSTTQTGLLIEQAGLRLRARRKFSNADRMFFTRVGLEQATDQWVATYKAARFAGTVADLCCGIGGDLMALSGRGAAFGVDRDPALTVLARANAAVAGHPCEAYARDATPDAVTAASAWHADPDRRPDGRRTTHTDAHSPNTTSLDAIHAVCPNAAIKLAPAAATPASWQVEREHEWISRRGECRQLVIWSGELATTPGKRRATALLAGGEPATFSGDPNSRAMLAPAPGRYLFEPDAAVLAACLDNALATHHTFARLTPAAAYYTGDRVPSEPLLTSYEIVDKLPLREKTIATYLRERRVGIAEIKHRGVRLDPHAFRKRLKLKGDASTTLIATTIGRQAVAFVANRVA